MLTEDDIFVCENGSPEDLKVHIAALRAENEKLWGDKYERSLVYERQRALIGQLETERDELQDWKEKAINLYPALEQME